MLHLSDKSRGRSQLLNLQSEIPQLLSGKLGQHFISRVLEVEQKGKSQLSVLCQITNASITFDEVERCSVRSEVMKTVTCPSLSQMRFIHEVRDTLFQPADLEAGSQKA